MEVKNVEGKSKLNVEGKSIGKICATNNRNTCEGTATNNTSRRDKDAQALRTHEPPEGMPQ